MTPQTKILLGDCRDTLKQLDAESVQCCVTSPPYWGLRSYLPKDHPDKAREIGQERTPDLFIDALVQVFAEVHRVLKKDGTLWLNIGDSYASGWSCNRVNSIGNGNADMSERVDKLSGDLKEKDLVGVPWMLAFALRKFGWYLRSDIIWHKPNCMPESVRDRPTRSHEYLFLLTKSERYYYDCEAIMEPASESFLNDPRHKKGSNPNNVKDGYEEGKAQNPKGPHRMFDKQRGHGRRHQGFNDRWDQMERTEQCSGMRNKRDVWTVSPACFSEAHFATFPPALITPCILAGSKPGDTVLDPFAGSGTTGQVSTEHGRHFIGCELNPDYLPLINRRTEQPGLILT